MMTPEPVVPTKWKAIVALVGALLTAIVPLVVQVSTSLPEPWPALIGGLVALATMFGVYKAPYKPAGTELVPVGTTPIAYNPPPPNPQPSTDSPKWSGKHPWK